MKIVVIRKAIPWQYEPGITNSILCALELEMYSLFTREAKMYMSMDENETVTTARKIIGRWYSFALTRLHCMYIKA